MCDREPQLGRKWQSENIKSSPKYCGDHWYRKVANNSYIVNWTKY